MASGDRSYVVLAVHLLQKHGLEVHLAHPLGLNGATAGAEATSPTPLQNPVAQSGVSMAISKSPLVANESPHPGRCSKPASESPIAVLGGEAEGYGCGRCEPQARFLGRPPPFCRASRMR